MTAMNPADDELDLRQLAAALWRRRSVVVIVVALAVAGALAANVLLPSVYESVAVIQLSEHSAAAYASPPSAANVITSLDFLELVAARSGLGISARDLERRRLVRAEPIRDTRMVRVRARADSPARARRLASTVVQTFLARASERVTERRRNIERQLRTVDAQLAEVRRILVLSREVLARLQRGAGMAEEDRGFVRTFTLNSLGVAVALYSGLSESQRALTAELLAVERPVVVQNPSRPLQPVSPRKALNATLAVVFGLMLGTILALVWDSFAALRIVAEPAGEAGRDIGSPIGREP
jgi:uncharacterized protein involved in exopolysaccharide biosynthesis